MLRSILQKCRPSYTTLAVVTPLIICTILNALIRPWLANRIGGTVVRSGSSTRGNNRWWTFDETALAEHPFLTGFLSTSDGAIAMASFGAVIILLLVGWMIKVVYAKAKPK